MSIGDKFGRLTVVAEFRRPAGGSNRGTRAWVRARCDCGVTKEFVAYSLTCGNTSSCGCLHRETVSAQFTTHGASKGYTRTRLYRIWRGMRERCTNQKARNYRWYGAKGITICAEWEDFDAFRQWAEAHGYADGLELDRRESEDGYGPDNCRWITKKANIRNRDLCWSDELDEKLVSYAAEHNVSPYHVIATIVAEFLAGGDELTW